MTRSHVSAPYATRHIDLGEVTLALDEWPGAGRTVLFLHATGFTRGVWRPTAALLTDRCRPLALDLRGHGGSSRPEPPYGWPRIAADVLRLAELEGWRDLVIVGHSLGGGAGILFEHARPDLVSALVLVEAPLRVPPASPPSSGGAASDLVARSLRRRPEWPTRDEAAAYLRARSPYDSWHPDAFAGFVDAGLRERDGQNGMVELACPREVEAAVFTGASGALLWENLAKVRCPVWIGRGDGDRGMPSTTSPEAATRPALAFDRVAEGAGHFAPLERPDWVVGLVHEALDYLDATPAGGPRRP